MPVSLLHGRGAHADATGAESAPGRTGDLDAVLARLASRYSCRDFDGSVLDRATVEAILADGTQAPSSCNHQNWHFIAVDDPALKRRAREISGGNHHFEFCSVLVFLCFQKGWTHDKFSIVQSVAGACYHMMLSAHLRGLSTIWNAGIGDTAALAAMLGVPPIFEIQGALAIGRATPTAPAMKAPRRPAGEVHSWNGFARPAHAVYPAKPAVAYPYFGMSNARNPYAEWRPTVWGWDRIADFRGYAVWAKSPLAGVYVSRRQGEATAVELGLLPPMAAGARVVEIMPWGGTTTTALRRLLPEGVHLDVAELSANNLTFIAERLRQEGLPEGTSGVVMARGKLPHDDSSVDAVVATQALEHAADPILLLDEIARVLKPGGKAVITCRNLRSAYGRAWLARTRHEPVPNQGPFVPLAARRVADALAARFHILRDIGIAREVEGDAVVMEGAERFGGRLYAALVEKRG
jgi:SAM-dependent methyltransferase